MATKLIERNSKGSITTTEGIEFDVWLPNGSHFQKHGKEVYARDELNSRRG